MRILPLDCGIHGKGNVIVRSVSDAISLYLLAKKVDISLIHKGILHTTIQPLCWRTDARHRLLIGSRISTPPVVPGKWKRMPSKVTLECAAGLMISVAQGVITNLVFIRKFLWEV